MCDDHCWENPFVPSGPFGWRIITLDKTEIIVDTVHTVYNIRVCSSFALNRKLCIYVLVTLKNYIVYMKKSYVCTVVAYVEVRLFGIDVRLMSRSGLTDAL